MKNFIIGFLLGLIVSAFYWAQVLKRVKEMESDNQ